MIFQENQSETAPALYYLQSLSSYSLQRIDHGINDLEKEKLIQVKLHHQSL